MHNSSEIKNVSLKSGIIWNLFALAFLAIAGIMLNLLIGRFYTPSALGLFNIIFALFILMGQLSTFGLQHATLQAVSTCAADMREISLVVRSALFSLTAINIIFVPTAIFITPLISWLYDGIDDISSAWLIVVPGLFFFSINKVLLAAINGIRHMRAFAIFQATRFMFILFFLSLILALDAPAPMLPGILTGAEIFLSPILIGYLSKYGILTYSRSNVFPAAIVRLNFGVRVLISGTLAELNTRVDVLMIGIYMQATDVGVYTVAILVFDAASQLIAVVRNNINPLIAKNVAANKFNAMCGMSRQIWLTLFCIFLLASIIAWTLFPIGINYLLPDTEYANARSPMVVLLFGLAVAGGVMSFNMALSQSNLPGWQSLFVISIVCVNIIANSIFIPIFGITGAAFGTITALIFSAILMPILCRKLVGLRVII